MLTTGGLLVAIALLALAIVAPVFRRAHPPRWTTRGWLGEFVTVAIVCTLALGLGYLGAGVIAALQAGLDLLDLGVLAGVVLVAIAIWRWLKARAGATGGPGGRCRQRACATCCTRVADRASGTPGPPRAFLTRP